MIINTIQGGKAPVVQSKSVKSTTSQQTITAPSGVDGYNPITVEPIKLQKKYGSPNTDSTYYKSVFPDSGYDGLSEVSIAPVPLQEKTVSPSQSGQIITPDTSNGYKGLSKVTVNAATLQSKTATLSTVDSQTIRPDSGYYGLSSVTVPMMNLQSKTVTPSDLQQIIAADSTYDGLNQVTVEAIPDKFVKTGFWLKNPVTNTRFRLSNTIGIVNPKFVVIQINISGNPEANILHTAIYDIKGSFDSSAIYVNYDNQLVIGESRLNVFLDNNNDILIETSAGAFIFNVNTDYNIFISE